MLPAVVASLYSGARCALWRFSPQVDPFSTNQLEKWQQKEKGSRNVQEETKVLVTVNHSHVTSGYTSASG